MHDELKAGRAFFRGHGLGNDYLVFGAGEDWAVRTRAIREVCDRWRGVGSDGIVVVLGREDGRFRLRMFNPDGSEFERSGNGLRIVAAHLYREGRVNRDPFEVEVGGDRVVLEVTGERPGGLYDVRAGMGRASFDPADIGLDTSRLSEGRIFHPEEGPLEFHAVSMGNPHCVVFTDELSEETLGRLGPALATHTAFRNGTNVQLAKPVDAHTIKALIWERGVGRTLASGTSSCAVAAAAVREGRAEAGEIEVRMEGGSLWVHVTEDMDVTLRGPVQAVCTGELTEGFVEALRERSADRTR